MGRSTLDVTERRHEPLEVSTLDDRISSLLAAIEEERIPERLLKLATDLQNALALRRQGFDPH